MEYSYMLDGFDKDWTSFSSINEASYLEIPSGSYVLRSVIRKMYLIRNIRYFLSLCTFFRLGIFLR